MLHILAFCGSLRQGSFNRQLLRAAQQQAPVGLQIEIADISEVPLYNGDVQDTSGFPAVVTALGDKVAAADAIIFATPEYNYSVPGVLKNTIDWLSRLPSLPFKDKPAAIMGASIGMFGTAHSQHHLRQVLVSLDVHPLNKPGMMVGRAHDKFDAAGQLIDTVTQELVAQQMLALEQWTHKLTASDKLAG